MPPSPMGAVRATMAAAAAFAAARSSQRTTQRILNSQHRLDNNESQEVLDESADQVVPDIDNNNNNSNDYNNNDNAQQQRARLDPFKLDKDDHELIDLTVPGGCSNFTPCEIRFDASRTFGVGSIKMDNRRSQYSISSYDGWFFKNYREGEDPDYRFDPKTKKQVPRFYMCGKLSTMAELHRSLRILLLGSRIGFELSYEQVMGMAFDDKGKLDTSAPQLPEYSKKICRFANNTYASYIDESTWTAASGNATPYMVLNIIRKKSEEAMKSSRSKEPFYTFDIPARKLSDAYNAVSKAMKANNIDPLPIDQNIIAAIAKERDDKEPLLSILQNTLEEDDNKPVKKRYRDSSNTRAGESTSKLIKKNREVAGKAPDAVSRFMSMKVKDERLKAIQKSFAAKGANPDSDMETNVDAQDLSETQSLLANEDDELLDIDYETVEEEEARALKNAVSQLKNKKGK